MHITQIQKIAQSLSNLIEDGEKISLPFFAAKVSKASVALPEDTTIGLISRVAEQMNDGNRLFITRAEVKELYNKFFTRNTKFASIFASELNIKASEEGSAASGFTANIVPASETKETVIDQDLVHQFDQSFGTTASKLAPSIAKQAKNICESELALLTIQASVDVINGDAENVICKASFETPKGKTTVVIPLDVIANKVLIPSLFIGNDGPEKLSFANLSNYVSKYAGETFSYSDRSAFKAAEENSEVVAPVLVDEEITSFANSFETPVGIASFKFGGNVVNLGSKLIAKRLKEANLKSIQISVANSDDSGILYAVAANNGSLAFNVPVQVIDKKVIEPMHILCNGSVESFDEAGIKNLINANSKDYKSAARASNMFVCSANDLLNKMQDAIKSENYSKAEEIMNVIAEKEDFLMYNKALNLYSNSLTTK